MPAVGVTMLKNIPAISIGSKVKNLIFVSLLREYCQRRFHKRKETARQATTPNIMDTLTWEKRAFTSSRLSCEIRNKRPATNTASQSNLLCQRFICKQKEWSYLKLIQEFLVFYFIWQIRLTDEADSFRT